MPESGTSGSVRGALRNERPYRELHDNQITRHENIACVVAPRQSSSRRDRQNGHFDCRCFPIQIVGAPEKPARSMW